MSAKDNYFEIDGVKHWIYSPTENNKLVGNSTALEQTDPRIRTGESGYAGVTSVEPPDFTFPYEVEELEEPIQEAKYFDETSQTWSTDYLIRQTYSATNIPVFLPNGASIMDFDGWTNAGGVTPIPNSRLAKIRSMANEFEFFGKAIMIGGGLRHGYHEDALNRLLHGTDYQDVAGIDNFNANNAPFHRVEREVANINYGKHADDRFGVTQAPTSKTIFENTEHPQMIDAHADAKLHRVDRVTGEWSTPLIADDALRMNRMFVDSPPESEQALAFFVNRFNTRLNNQLDNTKTYESERGGLVSQNYRALAMAINKIQAMETYEVAGYKYFLPVGRFLTTELTQKIRDEYAIAIDTMATGTSETNVGGFANDYEISTTDEDVTIYGTTLVPDAEGKLLDWQDA